MTRILIADDHAIVRKGLATILTKGPDRITVDEADSGEEALQKAWKNDYDLIVLDISMPGRGGLDVLSELRRRSPKLPVLILSMHPEGQYAVRALRAGASGYLTKRSAPYELKSAIQKVLSGGRYVSAPFAELLAATLEIDYDKPLQETLSDREYHVFRMIASGKTVSEIAGEMSLSVNTISTYRTRVLEKMKMKNNSELMQYALVHRLLD
jgi:DNA-binding NarL/FixJ family response regulator